MMAQNQIKFKTRPRLDADDAELCYRMQCSWCGSTHTIVSDDSKGLEDEQIEDAFREAGYALAQDDDTYGVACKSCQHYRNLEVANENYSERS